MTLKQRIHDASNLEHLTHALQEYGSYGGELVKPSETPQWYSYRDLFPFESDRQFTVLLEQAMSLTLGPEGLRLEVIHPLN